MIYTLTLNPAIDRELTIPAMEFDSVLRAVDSRIDLGGKGFNVSRLLIRLNVESVSVGFVGGKAGEILEDGLQSLKIHTDFVHLSGETRTNISIVTQPGGHYIKVNEKGPMVDAVRQTELLEKISGLAKEGDWWILAGSLPPGVPDDFYAQVLSILNDKKAFSILDTIDEPFKLGCLKKPFLVKPNVEEACNLTGMPVYSLDQIAKASEKICTMGAQNVVISLGKDGAILHSPHGSWFAKSPPVVERNPIGAGDSMVGGLVYGFSRGETLPECLKWGIACGAAAASLGGTDAGSEKLIKELFDRVVLEKV